jgi:hypothetical protein
MDKNIKYIDGMQHYVSVEHIKADKTFFLECGDIGDEESSKGFLFNLEEFKEFFKSLNELINREE